MKLIFIVQSVEACFTKVMEEDDCQKISIYFFCESAGEDEFSFRIKTGLTVFDIEEFEEGKPLRKMMTVELIKRKSHPYKED